MFPNAAVKPEYVFEAKRLKKKIFTVSKYVGKEGLQCFVKGSYASQYSEAAMVGYDQSGDANHWQKELKKNFDKNSRNDLCVKQALQKVQVISSMPDIWVSQHERKDYELITVYHIFLNCSALSSQITN